MNAIDVTDLTVAYNEKPVLWDVDLSVPRGVLMAIVGPNGAGKTTLIKAILGLIKPAAGQVLIDGKPYNQQRLKVGYVPQRGSVDWDFPTSVLDVVMMGRYGALGWFRRPGAKERAAALEALMTPHARVCRTPDQPAFRRAAAARLSGPRPGAGRTNLLHGRTIRWRRCRDRKNNCNPATRPACGWQDCASCPS